MKRVLVFQHVAYELLGTLHPLLKKAGFRIRYLNFGRSPQPTVEMVKYDGLVILGGPMGVYEAETHPHLAYEMECIREAIRQEKPVLGICLGAQLTAAALGATVSPGKEKEIGWYPVELTEEGAKDPVLGELGQTETIFQWHGDVFDLPREASWLASSSACRNQAFRYGDRVYGFQFHLEVDEPMIERWLTLPEHQELLAEFPADHIRAATQTHITQLKELSDRVFTRYIELFSTKRRTVVLGSGHK